MAYDIYGEVLTSGFCEVHPHVRESYPCSVCYDESRKDAGQLYIEKQQEQEYRKAETEHYRHEWCMDNSLQYRIVYRLKVWCEKMMVTIGKKCPF